MNSQLPSDSRDPRTHAIIGAAMEVHRQLGHGFLEAVYYESFARELMTRSVPYRCEANLRIFYKGEPLSTFYKADFICFDCIIVELKALAALTGVESAQVINYLKATGYELGLLINFGSPSLEFQRLFHPKTRASLER